MKSYRNLLDCDVSVQSVGFRHLRLAFGTLVAALTFVLSANPVQPQPAEGYWFEVRTLHADDLGIESILGLAYDPEARLFYVVDGSGITLVNPMADVVGRHALETASASDAVFSDGALFMYDAGRTEMIEWQPAGGDATLARPPARRFAMSRLVLGEVQGIAAGAAGQLFVLDSSSQQVLHVALAADGPALLGRTSLPDGRPAWVGLAYDAARHSLYAATAAGLIYELALTGEIVAIRDMSALNLSEASGLTIAPSGDPTDDPATASLYIAADERLIEVYLTSPVMPTVTTTQLAATQFRTVNTSAWSPPSPDPAGIDYSAKYNRLLIADSEVEEMPIFQGTNLFQATTAGALNTRCNITGFTDEPTGVATNPSNGAVFITDDNADEVFEVRAGPDNKLCTADDVVRHFDTRAFNSFDPEGLAFGSGMLFVSDGEGAEVYVIHPGGNGRFDGLPPAGDDRLHDSFDTASLGMRDPEGIGYHAQRNSLFLVSRLDRRVLVEASATGALLNTFDIAALNAVFPAGVGVGPASGGSGQSIYIVDRGVDNDENPNENDGKFYEVSLTDDPQPADGPLYLSRAADGARTVGNLAGTADEDILHFDGEDWRFLFDGSDVLPASLDVDAFAFIDNDSLLLSFAQPGTVAGVGSVDDSDIVRFDAASLGANTAGTFSLYFDGSAVGLTTNGEDVDSLSRLSDGRLLISTLAAYSVLGASGRGDDILAFTPTALGSSTNGTWALHFDGSDVGITPRSNIDGAGLKGSTLYLTTANAISRDGLSAADEDVFVCDSAVFGSHSQCSFAPLLYFDGSVWGLGGDDVDAIHVP